MVTFRTSGGSGGNAPRGPGKFVSGSTGPDVRAAEERTFAGIMAGRERVRFVLEPVLGPQQALERANNIVQALALDGDQPLLVALDMLRLVPEDRRVLLAQQVSEAWLALEAH